MEEDIARRSYQPDPSTQGEPATCPFRLVQQDLVIAATQLVRSQGEYECADEGNQNTKLVRERSTWDAHGCKEFYCAAAYCRRGDSDHPDDKATSDEQHAARDSRGVPWSRQCLRGHIECFDEGAHHKHTALWTLPSHRQSAQHRIAADTPQVMGDSSQRFRHPSSVSSNSMRTGCKIGALKQNIASVYMGNLDAIDRLVICLLARGHVLIEDVPGVGKTVLAQSLARSVHCSFGRIQCTPDLLPSDITGVGMFDRETGHVIFRRGPVFASIVLADEINRATPRTQSALLEAMAEGTVSAEGEVHILPNPFMVIATQNPNEFEGTYLLPENQLDRFLMRIGLGYPAAADESRIIHQQPARTALAALQPVMDGDDVAALQREVDAVRIDQTLVDYIIAIAHATRRHPQLQLGVSPRGALAVAQTARATARCAERDFVLPEDILENIIAVCAHRVVPKSTGARDGSPGAVSILTELLGRVPSPV